MQLYGAIMRALRTTDTHVQQVPSTHFPVLQHRVICIVMHRIMHRKEPLFHHIWLICIDNYTVHKQPDSVDLDNEKRGIIKQLDVQSTAAFPLPIQITLTRVTSQYNSSPFIVEYGFTLLQWARGVTDMSIQWCQLYLACSLTNIQKQHHNKYIMDHSGGQISSRHLLFRIRLFIDLWIFGLMFIELN